MTTQLVIVESPAKARAIQKYLGAGFKVIASMGHVMDLPKKGGIIIEKKGKKTLFTPIVEPIKGKEKQIKEMKSAAKKASTIFLAPDPDREGEVIAFHIAQILECHDRCKRVLFHEITPKAVRAAFDAPLEIDMRLVESQQSRRILDRIVGFDVSQLLWEKVARGLSAGRVQTVALRIIVEREREIKRFTPVESWSVTAELAKDGKKFEAKLTEVIGKGKATKIALPDEASAKKVLSSLSGKPITVTDVALAERRRFPVPPFITSTLQQEASRRLGMPVSVTMRYAQQLYEGIDIGEEGTTGLITYMRTDSVRVSPDAIEDARSYIKSKIGKAYLPAEPIIYKTKKAAQDAHEAIRPTSAARNPSVVAKYLDRKALAVYKLIWSRFLASQCVPAVYDNVGVDLAAGDYKFRATGSTLKFKGFLKVYGDIETDDVVGDEENPEDRLLPPLKVGDKPELLKYLPRQHFTQPPPRFSEATLVKALEEKNIGRPSTYASIISTLRNRAYTSVDKRRLYPTDLGMSVTDLLVKAFPDIFNIDFTAHMEDELDEVEEGKTDWQKELNEFHKEFLRDMKSAGKEMPNLKAGVPTEFICPTCGSIMLLRYGKMGRFLACSKYPDCKTTFEVKEAPDGTLQKLETPKFAEKCPKCGADMLFKRSRFGAFLACSKYPECKGVIALKKIGEDEYEPEPVEKVTRLCPLCGGGMEVKRSRFGRFIACEKYPECKGALPYFMNVPCVSPGCEGELVERQMKRGVAYSCNKFPDCKFRSYDFPVAVPCPVCAAPAMFRSKDGPLKCARENCTGLIEEKEQEPESDFA